jgi:2-polyprenyl-6-methoxyphenol hydroxylase-like FAD-dependent oxidoreductase
MTKAHRIAITGAGIGGLAAASLLARDGHSVTLFERFITARPVGSGLVVQPVGLAVLDRLDAGESARSLGATIHRMQGHTASRRILDATYPQGRPGLAMHRASLFHCLWQAASAAGITPITGHTATGTQDSGGAIRLLTDQGSHGPFDLVIDAAGAGSALSPLAARPLPFGAVWTHVPWPKIDLPATELRQRYHRASRMAGVLPIGRLPDDPTPRAAVFWSLSAAELDMWPTRDLDDWKAEVSAFWPAMQPFVSQITDKAQITPVRYSHGSLRRPHTGRLIHIGDAAHRASPQLGQGANMALLDALSLTLALRLPLDEALNTHHKARRAHLALYQHASSAFTPQYQSHSRALPLLRDHVLAPLTRLWPLPGLISQLVAGDILPPIAGTRFPDP